jgi:uncharacterized membrane protein
MRQAGWEPDVETRETSMGGVSLLVSALIALLLSLLFALLLEAGTLFGSFTSHVTNFSQWLPQRIFVFFMLSLAPAVFAARRIMRWLDGAGHVSRDWHRLTWSAMAVVVSTLFGMCIGIPVAIVLGDPGDVRYGLCLTCVVSAIALLVVHRDLLPYSFEWGFLILGLAFGGTFALLMPPAAEISWDGSTHFKNANGLSYIVDAEYNGADQLMVIGATEGALYLTGDLSGIEEQWVELDSRLVQFPHAYLEDEVIYPANDALREAERDMMVVTLVGTEAYPSGNFWSFRSIGLIPNAVGLWIGRLLHVGCIGRYFLARLAGVIAYVVTFFFAVRALRRGKLIMSAIGLCPTSLLMAANFSYDPWTISMLALSIGNFVGALQRRELIGWRQTLGMCVPFVLGGLVKAVLFPLGILLFLIPSRRFDSDRNCVLHRILVCVSVLALVASFVLPYLLPGANADAGSDDRGGSDVSVSGQIAYVLSHPLETLMMSVRFTFGMLNPAVMGFAINPSDENMLYYFPYLIATDAPLNELVAGVEYVLLIAVSLIDGGPEDEGFSGASYKICAFLACLLSFALIAAALYASFTDVGRNVISGVQYRYLLPLLAPFLLVVCNLYMRRIDKGIWPTISFTVFECALLSLVLLNSFMVLL